MSRKGGPSSGRRLFDADRLLLSCWVMAAGGQVSAATKQAEAIGTIAVSRGQLAFGVLALHEAMRLGSPTARAPLVEAAAGCDTLIAAASGRHASALLAADADELVACSAAFRELGLVMCAAEASIEASQRLQGPRSRRFSPRCLRHSDGHPVWLRGHPHTDHRSSRATRSAVDAQRGRDRPPCRARHLQPPDR